MKLKANDQIHVSSVQADTLRPGQVFEVSDSLGEELLRMNPSRLEKVEVAKPAAKAEPAPLNKAEVAPSNKAEPKRESKGK